MIDKKYLNYGFAGLIAIGAIGYVFTGGTDAGAGEILSTALVLVGAIGAVWKAIKG